MLTRVRKIWDRPDREVTAEHLYLDRRRLVVGLAAGPALLAGGSALGLLAAGSSFAAEPSAGTDPSSGLYPVARNVVFDGGRPLTDEAHATQYNNFYEFGSHKRIARAAQKLAIRPWEIAIDGMVEKPFAVAIDDLLKKMPLEERVYRLRCVEAWAMTVPWSGFALRHLVDLAKPLSGARYLTMTTFQDEAVAPGQKEVWYPWPYREGLTLAEATNDLAFLATGVYGKPLPRQNGSPLRLAVPWKYGFKSVKSIVRFTFTDTRPVSFWEKIQPREYGFWANVNPDVPHPRWSQATERLLGSDERVKTQLFNGYGDLVAGLYAGLKNERLYT